MKQGLVTSLKASAANDKFRGIDHLARCLKELQAALTHQVPEDIAVTMANLQGCIDWFQVSNGLELSPQRIEAEYYRYEEADEDTTVREWPPQ